MLWHGKRETGVDAFKLATSIFCTMVDPVGVEKKPSRVEKCLTWRRSSDRPRPR